MLCRIKANSPGKILNFTNISTKAGPPNHQIGLPLNSSFLYELKRPPFGDAINFDCVSPPSSLHFYQLRMAVFVIILSF